MSNANLERFVSGIESIPSLPSLYLELMEEMRSPTASARRVSQIIAKDLAMTAKILKLANSAYFAFAKEVTHVERAVVLLGMELIKNLVLVINAFSQFETSRMRNLPIAGLWRHSMSCSVLARGIAQTETRNRELIDQCTTAAFLHDVGKLILATSKAQEYHKAFVLAQQQDIPLYVAEKQVFGFDHAELGGHLLEIWGLPQLLVEAVNFHHYPSLCRRAEFSPLTAVHVANFIEHSQNPGEAEPAAGEMDAGYLKLVSADGDARRWRHFGSSNSPLPELS